MNGKYNGSEYIAMDNKIVYSKLFDEVAYNMRQAGENMPIKKEVFMVTVNTGCSETDISVLRCVDKEDFLEATFEVVLRRLPELAVVKNWYKNKIFDEKAWRISIINRVLNSVEYKTKAVPVINNIYANDTVQNTIRFKARVIDYLYPKYKRLPNRIRIIVWHMARKLRIIGGE